MAFKTSLGVMALAVGSMTYAIKSDVLKFVDPLIGTINGGHVFPGATLPFGMAKAVADTNGAELQGGFASDDSDIIGFSHMHDSGTGGGASLGNFPLFPQSGCLGGVLNNCYFAKALRASKRVNETVVAEPGYFAMGLNTSINTEMTVTNHTALYRFTFPDTPVPMKKTDQGSVPNEPLILVDLTDLSNSRSKANISVDDRTGRITGSGTFKPSFGIGTYTLHFCADFDGAKIKQTGVFQNNRAGTEPKHLSTQTDGSSSPPVPAGAFVQFKAPGKHNQITARVGLSFISPEKACSNAEKEIGGFNFNRTRQSARDAWSSKLGVVEVDTTGVNETFQTVFWSGMYRTMISPQDYTGENPLWKSDEPYYDSYYCIWDSYRSIHPLLTLLDPVSQTLMVRSLIDIYRHEGKLPDCRMSLCKGFTQGGSNADVVLADAYVKGLHDGIDWKTGYEAVVSDAEDEPPVWSVEGRGGLASWKKLGYIPTDDFDPFGVGPFTRSISRTVEYAYNDYCIAEMAKGLKKQGDAEKYLKRAENWSNMFNKNQQSTVAGQTFTGFLQPKYLNGTFGFQDPTFCTPLLNFTSCYLNANGHETYEGSCWLYTFYAPHDMSSLITTLGGPDEFVRRLQFLHDTPDLLYMGDEQGFLMVYLFHYAGRPGLSSFYQHFYIPSQFNDTVVGIPGNDDSGAMGSFSTLAMMGLWPVSGQDVYLINPPFFPEVTITNGMTGKKSTIRNINFDAKYENIYIQSATLDGKPYTRNWITHDFFSKGGVLELTLGKNESSWGTNVKDLPPSMKMSSQ
ncbi:alpha-1,2-mannosidase subfamily [Purpureocillium lavendulum]|uniref:Alpha-1,2-mannosidase subfamily n=1 Tax=Purpureocillium lavendulum TaxID=1247861 RepID=A0AB34G329_9HYPO|nr:alpha-1,2-mannosidase subfamily [Purpureocillium lavendulum]